MIALHAFLVLVSWLIARQYYNRRDGFALLMVVLAGVSVGSNIAEIIKRVTP